MALTVLATLVALVAVGALVVVLADRSQEPVAQETEGAVDPSVPVLGGAPPTGLELDDRGTSVGLTWADPAKGKAPFIITMAKRGEQLRSVAHVDPGTVEFVERGLNADLDYCFAVVAVYSTKQVSSSVQACTKRGTARPQR
ncbi:fibronectin type III domain-containing protein [Actinoplanes campanulatus]|uniref:fibronectin type III domain-containing protein n=1 Tax=Actinoplanes campanulatus TaxID=113559 RepID=UPI001EF336D0|nr:fibronectin type III domain-containing protein [Actinoplanes capillaceus]